MGQIILENLFTLEERKRILERYHFEAKDEKRLEQMVHLLGSFVRARAWYKVCTAGEIEGIWYQKYVVVLVTLSEYVDRLIALESEAGNLSEAYMLDCIALECLDAAYRQAADKIYEETRLWQGRYEFPGDSLSLEYLPRFLELFSEASVKLNSVGMMVPAKSVVYLAELREKQWKEKNSVCSGCQNLSCTNRLSMGEENFDSVVLDQSENGCFMMQLNYGYQRIFGGKRE